MNTLKVPPHSQEAENALIGAALFEPQVMDRVSLKSEEFYDRRNVIFWQSLIDMRSSGKAMDAITIGEYLKETGVLEKVGGYDRLIELQDSIVIPEHARSYADEVKKAHNCRSVAGVCIEGYDESMKGKAASASVMAALTSLSETKPADFSIEVHAENFIEQCKAGDVGHLEWWCPEWTAMMGKLSTELVILHAPRSTGKTAMMLQWITETHRNGQVAPLVSIEMLKRTLAPRFIANIGQVSTFTMKARGAVTPNEDVQSKMAIKEIRALDIRVREDEASIDDIFQYAISENNRKRVDAIWVDNLLCINDGGKNYQSKTIMYDAFIKKFRELRNVLEVPVFVLAHPNADGNIAWSKDVENIADIIIYLEQVQDEGVLLKETGQHVQRNHAITGKHILAKFQKHRDGKQPTASLNFVGATQTFSHIGWESEG